MTRRWDASAVFSSFITVLSETIAGLGLRVFLVVLLTTLFSINMVALTAAKHQGDDAVAGFHFEYVTVTLSQEFCKLVVAWYCFRREMSNEWEVHWGRTTATFFSERRPGKAIERLPNTFQTSTFFLFSIPGLLYCLDMNFQYIILSFLEPTELSILWNFKVFATAALLHIFLNRRYTPGQWMALLLLILGCILTQASAFGPKTDGVAAPGMHQTQTDEAADNAQNEAAAQALADTDSLAVGLVIKPSAKLIGACLAIFGSSVAASSNVFCEWLIKQHPEDSVHFQNMQLYTFGVAMNMIALWAKASSEPASPINTSGFFAGYTSWVWAVVILGAASGLIISFTLKFVDNIAVVFAHAIAVLIASVISSGVFGLELSLPFVAGGILVLLALVWFHLATPPEPPSNNASRSHAGIPLSRKSSWSTAPNCSASDQSRPMYCLDESQ